MPETLSLKDCHSSKSVRQRVDTWNEKDCEAYCKKHEKSHSSPLIKQKINIVIERFLNLSIRYGGKVEKFPDSLKAYLDIIPMKTLLKYVPDEYKDEQHWGSDELKKLKSHQKNTGVYLWACGYKPEKIMGKGCNGVVWCCGDKAVKVTANRKILFLTNNAVKNELKEAKNLENMHDSWGRGKDYWNVGDRDRLMRPSRGVTVGKGDVGITEADLADKDVEHYSEELKNVKEKKEKIKKVLKLAKDVVSGLKVLHDAGFSHNDVKPRNLLKIGSKLKGNVKAEEMFKVADFGNISPINHTYRIVGGRYFSSPDMKNLRSECVAKRDVWSLGATLLYMLISDHDEKKAKSYVADLQKCNNDNDNDIKEFAKKYKILDFEKSEEGFGKFVLRFLKIISDMTKSDYRSRMSMQSAAIELRALKIA